jgi:hypothetical protein
MHTEEYHRFSAIPFFAKRALAVNRSAVCRGGSQTRPPSQPKRVTKVRIARISAQREFIRSAVGAADIGPARKGWEREQRKQRAP